MGEPEERVAELRRELYEAEAEVYRQRHSPMNDAIREAAARPALPSGEAIARRLGLVKDEED